eukprot:834572_1
MAASTDTNNNSVWACAICTFENQSIRKLCEMCGNRKPGPKIDDDKGWKCILCTVVNPTEAIACQMCGAPNHLINDLTGKQLCGSCTSINLANAHSCSVCGQPLNNQIIQKDDNGELTMVDMNTNKHNNNNNIHQHANPFVDNNDNNNNIHQPSFYNGYNNYYQPQPQQQPQPQPQPQYNNNYPSHSHNTMPPIPPQQYQQYQPQPQQDNNNAMGSIGGMFGGMGSWFGGNNNNTNNNVKHSHSSSKKHKHKKKKKRSHNKYNISQNHNQDNANNKEIQFKDVSEIFKNDEKDKKRIKQEEEEVKKLSEWYAHVYLTKKKHYDKKIITDIINKMIH